MMLLLMEVSSNRCSAWAWHYQIKRPKLDHELHPNKSIFFNQRNYDGVFSFFLFFLFELGMGD